MDSDFTIAGGGTLYILRPNTNEAKAWVEEHIPADAQRWSGGVAVEWRFIRDIIDGIQAAGLEVA